MVTLVVAILAMFAGTMFNNSRIGDVNGRIGDMKGDVNARMNELNGSVNARMNDLNGSVNARMNELNGSVNARMNELRTDLTRHLDDKFSLLSQQIKQMEDNILRQLGDHETRIQTLEKPE